MALGDGIRRNIAHVSAGERTRFRDAVLKLDRERFFPDGVSYFDKQEDIHKNAHAGGANVHGGPAFIPWHRELCNRFEALLREVDPDLSLHYWDWTTDPRSSPDSSGGVVNLLTQNFMGGTGDPVGAPFDDFESTQPGHSLIWRDVGGHDANPDGTPAIPSDADVKNAADFATLDANISGPHSNAHGYIGGTLSDAHYSFHDSFVFLLHSNLDRLWAEWQTEPGHQARLAGATAYGPYSASPSINEDIQPWAGDVGTGATPLRPWAPPDNMQEIKTYKDVSVVTPPCYDTLPTMVRVVTAENPGMVIGFHQVPEGETAIRGAVFETRTCGELTFRVTAPPNPPFQIHLPADGVLHVPKRAQILQIGRIWFRFTAGTAGPSVPSSDVTIHCDETNADFVFHLEADVIQRPKVAVLMTLDQSWSMNDPAGIDPTTKRIDVLHSAAANFIQLVEDQNGVGIVSFDNVAHPRTAVTRFTGGAFDPAKAAALTAVQAIQPGSSTSIGAGLQLARNTLGAATGYDRKAILVFTDGFENTAPWISDVAGTIDDRTFAIGLGTAQEVSVGALTALAHHTQGYLLLSGPLSPSIDDYFRLTKYFLQVLAGMTNHDIVTDPQGYIGPGTVLRIPFELNETDIDATMVLLGDTSGLTFGVETPNGDVLTPGNAGAAGALFRATSGMDYYRFDLPLTLGGDPAHTGTWYALLAVRRFERAVAGLSRALRYSVSVHAFSNLRMRAQVSQSSFEPGARLSVRSSLTEYGVPVDHRATVDTDVERPDGTSTTLHLTEVDPGVFEGSLVGSLDGVYRFRVRASGGTMRGEPFTREQLLTAAILHGGDRPPPRSDPTGNDETKALCELLTCLLEADRFGRLLQQHGVDVAAVRRCLRNWCRRRLGPRSGKELRAREGAAAAPPQVSRETATPTERMIATVAEILKHAERERRGGDELQADR